ncbi:ABC transporter permease [Cardiobacterium hominis]|uniref:ABC transporter permease n=1 Tax=Cardiobacterium hominis TaxID=2718 RepID=UPI0028D3FAB0|nr:ABC transporter permease [Cardiobacterium hominis]
MPTPDRPLIRHPLLRQYGGIVIALIILCAVFTIANSRFLSLANFMNIFQQVAVVAIAAFGMTWVILLGEIDLSVGSIIAVAGMVGAQSLALGTGFPAALLITIIAGAILGAVNGLLTARLLLPSFIVTLATMSIYRGLVSLPTGGAPAMISDSNWQAIGASSFLGLPLIIWILLILFLANHIALSMTVFGRQTYLTGGNREAALYSGIRVGRVKIIVFTLSGIMSAIAGILLSSRLYSAQTNAGVSYELDAIAAAVLGGTSLSGGVGTIPGTLIGALIIGVLNNGMNMLSIHYFIQLVVKGVVILVAVWLDVRAKRRKD